jgi:precorrin-6Y C5,15-methyltransferase (decarboxylating)
LADTEKVYVIGMGDDGLNGLTQSARARLEQAELLIGTEHTLSLVGDLTSERVVAGPNLDDMVQKIVDTPAKRIVVLASGDPLFYGTARYLCSKLGKERFEVLPHVSSMQLAFARVKESWEDAFLTDVSRGPFERLLDKIRVADTVGLFTSEQHTPGDVARALLDAKIDYFFAYVCENLGSPDERVTQGDLTELIGQQFASPNVMILSRQPDVPDRPTDRIGQRLFGNRDDAFLQSKPKSGLLTPAEVRSMALAQLDLGPASTFWDVGAGSGSVAIEAAQIASQGKVYAIEMDVEDYDLIKTNAQRFNVENLEAVNGSAPEAWKNLPDPDAIFVGGSGRMVARLVELAYQRLRPGGRLVANVGSIENLAEVNQVLNGQGTEVEVWMINIARGTYQLDRVRFDPLSPTFLLAATKAAKGA